MNAPATSQRPPAAKNVGVTRRRRRLQSSGTGVDRRQPFFLLFAAVGRLVLVLVVVVVVFAFGVKNELSFCLRRGSSAAASEEQL